MDNNTKLQIVTLYVITTGDQQMTIYADNINKFLIKIIYPFKSCDTVFKTIYNLQQTIFDFACMSQN